MQWRETEVVVKRTARKKTMSIVVERDGTLAVLVPREMKESDIRKYLDTKEYAIVKNQELWRISNDERIERHFETGQSYLFKGQNYPLTYAKSEQVKIKHLIFSDTAFILPIGVKDPRKEFLLFYRNECRIMLSERYKVFSGKIPVQPKKIAVRDMKTRWGSCTPTGNIYLNWRCVMAPQFVFDYLLAHELVHLKYHKHTQDFWGTVSLLVPQYEEAKAWLTKNGVKMEI